MTPSQGRTRTTSRRPLRRSAASSGPSRPVSSSTMTPTFEEVLSRWLDQQAWVEQWNTSSSSRMFFKPQLIVASDPAAVRRLAATRSRSSLFAFPLAIVGGLAAGVHEDVEDRARSAGSRRAYINVIRGTPLFLQIFVASSACRIAGIRAPIFVTAVIVLALNSSAYLAEIFRAGIQSISQGPVRGGVARSA